MTGLAELLRGGIIPAVPVPFDAQGEINDPELRRYARWMGQQRASAVALWAHTGRGLLLSIPQRDLVLDIWRESTGTMPIICGVGSPNLEDLPKEPAERTKRVIDSAVEMAETARAGGASGVLVYPPTALRGLPDTSGRVVDLHRAVVDVGLSAVAFYLYEAAGGIPYSLDTVFDLLDIDGVIGIKLATLDSVVTFQDVAAIVSRSDKLLISGEDRFLGYSLMLGADSALIGMAAACTDKCVALMDAWLERDLKTFVRLATKIDRFSLSTFSPPLDGYVQRMLWALEDDGVLTETSYDPFAPAMDDSERRAVRDAVAELRSE